MGGSQARRPALWAVSAALGASCGFAAWMAFDVGGEIATRYMDDIATALAAGGAAGLCLRSGLRPGGSERRFWLLLGAACVAWGLAETTWALYDLVLREPVPVVSWADVGYLSALPLAAAALLSHSAMHQGARRARAALDGLCISTATLLLSWTFVLGPLWRHTDLTSAGGVVVMAYPFGDVVLVVLAVMVMRNLRSWRLSTAAILAGVLAMAIADTSYAYLSEVQRYASGNLIDIGWVVAYLAIGVGAISADGESAPARDLPAEAADPVLFLVAPYLVMFVALGAIGLAIHVGRPVDRLEWLMALGLALLVIARQVTMACGTAARHFRPEVTEPPDAGSDQPRARRAHRAPTR